MVHTRYGGPSHEIFEELNTRKYETFFQRKNDVIA